MEYSMLFLLSALPSADLFWLPTTKSGSFIQALFFPKPIQTLALFQFKFIAVTWVRPVGAEPPGFSK